MTGQCNSCIPVPTMHAILFPAWPFCLHVTAQASRRLPAEADLLTLWHGDRRGKEGDAEKHMHAQEHQRCLALLRLVMCIRRASASADLLHRYDGPTAFAIPGNHDWIDGLETYTRHIQHKGWLGGWLLPQVCLSQSYYSSRHVDMPNANVAILCCCLAYCDV